MAVNKNFVVKNGLEVNENLIVANATDSFVGVGTSTPNNTLHVFGGIGATDVRVTGISSFIQNVYVGASGTTFSVVDITGSLPAVGVGTDLPEYLLDVRSSVSTGQTALYVQGDARVTGDLIADDIVLDQANFTNIDVAGFTTTRELVVGYGASIAGITTIGALTRAAAGSGGTSFTFNPAPGLSTNLTVIGDSYFEGRLKIKDDLDVDTNLFIVGILTSQSIHVGSAFTVAGISTFMSDVNVGGKVQTGLEIAGVTTTASSGGITTTGGDLWVGGDLYISDDVTIDTDINIIGIATVGVLSARDTVVSGASTVNGNFTVGGDATVIGDLNVTGDISYDEVSGRNLNITGIATIHTLGVTSTTTTQDLAVGGASTITGVLNVSNTTESTTKDTGAVLIEGGVGIEKNLNLGTTIKMDSTAGVITATIFKGVGEVIGIGSEGTPIGTGVSFVDFRTTSGTGVSCQPAVNGIATVTFTPGASLGMVLALGG